ncbi:hypothetical protein EV426DRAFT_672677 [Tirmania nivea]|nr:hypothetical protein EV426DRAFT_672677 [Tirmania nivea]
MDHSRLITRLPKHDAIDKRPSGLRLFRPRPNLLIKTDDLQFKAGDDNNELDVIESYRLDTGRGNVYTPTNSAPPRHLQCSSRDSLNSARLSAAAALVSPLDSGLSTATNSLRSSTILTPANTIPPTPSSTVPSTPANTIPPSEYVSQSLVLPQEYTDAWLESQLAKAEQGLCGLRTELMFYYQRKIMKENTTQSMKEVYGDRREGHTRAIAEYMTTGVVRPSGVQDITVAIQSGPQGVGFEMDELVKEVEQIDEVNTNKAAEQTGKAVGQTGRDAEQSEKAVGQTEISRPGEISKQMMPYVSSPSTISIIEATPAPALVRAPHPLSSPCIRRRKSPPSPAPIDGTELPPVPPLKSVLRQLSVPVGAVPLMAANYHIKERSSTPPAMAAPGLDTETSTDSPSPPPNLLPEAESLPTPPVQSIQEQLREPGAIILSASLSSDRLPEIESPPVPLPTVPPRPAFIRGKNRSFTSPAMLQLPPGPGTDTEALTVGLFIPPLPTAEVPPIQWVPQQLPIVPPRPAFIRGKTRNSTAPGPVTETGTVSPPLPPLLESLPVAPLHGSSILIQQQLAAAVLPIARLATRVEKRSVTASGLLAPSSDRVMATLDSATAQRRPFLLPSVASSRAGTSALTVPMTADESRRKVPTRLNNFSDLLETFNQRPAPAMRQPNSKLKG